jgi:hypothetical protein
VNSQTLPNPHAAQNFTGARGNLIVNCGMIKRALCVALGLLGALFPVTAQQTRHQKDQSVAAEQSWTVGALQPSFGLSFYQPKILSAANRSLLFHKGPVTTWWDGGWLANENALTQIGMASLNLFPVSFLPSEVFGAVPAQRGNAASGSRPKNSMTDGKDSTGEPSRSPLDEIYYGGEIGVLYGQWSGKGGGDLFETYIMGTVGNDKFQITAGAAYQEWSGRALKFRSFAAPR